MQNHVFLNKYFNGIFPRCFCIHTFLVLASWYLGKIPLKYFKKTWFCNSDGLLWAMVFALRSKYWFMLHQVHLLYVTRSTLRGPVCYTYIDIIPLYTISNNASPTPLWNYSFLLSMSAFFNIFSRFLQYSLNLTFGSNGKMIQRGH